MRSCRTQKNEKYMISLVLNTSSVVARRHLRRKAVALTRRSAERILSQETFPVVWVGDAHIRSQDPTLKTLAFRTRKTYSLISLNKKEGSMISTLDLAPRLVVVVHLAGAGEEAMVMVSQGGRGSDPQER